MLREKAYEKEGEGVCRFCWLSYGFTYFGFAVDFSGNIERKGTDGVLLLLFIIILLLLFIIIVRLLLLVVATSTSTTFLLTAFIVIIRQE